MFACSWSVALELVSLHNVDLFQRGFYNVQLKFHKPEGGFIRLIPSKSGHGKRHSVSEDGRTAISSMVRISYRRQSCLLANQFAGTIVTLVSSEKLLRGDIQGPLLETDLELCFLSPHSSGGFPKQSALEKVSCRKLHFHFPPGKHQLHSERHLLFEWGHLAGVVLQLHLSLTDIKYHQQGDVGLQFHGSANAEQTSELSCQTQDHFISRRILRHVCKMLLDSKYNLIAKLHDLVSGPVPAHLQPELRPNAGEENVKKILATCDEDITPSFMEAVVSIITDDISAIWTSFLKCIDEIPEASEHLADQIQQSRITRFEDLILVQQVQFEDAEDICSCWNTQLSDGQLDMVLLSVRKFVELRMESLPLGVACADIDGLPNSVPIILQTTVRQKLKEACLPSSLNSTKCISFPLLTVKNATSLSSLNVEKNLEVESSAREESGKSSVKNLPLEDLHMPMQSHANVEETNTDECRPLCSSPLPARHGSSPEGTRQDDEEDWHIVSQRDCSTELAEIHDSVLQSLSSSWHFLSDVCTNQRPQPYFSVPRRMAAHQHQVHLVVCVHGLQGTCYDLRMFQVFLELALPEEPLEFLMSSSNENKTFESFEVLTENLVDEIGSFVSNLSAKVAKLSFVGYSLGNIIIRSALVHRKMSDFLPLLHVFVSFAGPHLGTVYSNSVVGAGIWVLEKWKKSGSLRQLAMRDNVDLRESYLYLLSLKPGLSLFKSVLLVASHQDEYVPYSSARIQLSAMATNDKLGCVQREMIAHLLEPLSRTETRLVVFDVTHHFPSSTDVNVLLGRAGHIAMLDSDLFIETFVLTCCRPHFHSQICS